ncbi:unnamed protein product [marine sediment metagenome]|uniref:Uncharacterized protein n=1 Tax=marine sediment metagenome TaxID=412755 RepID=X1K5T1_9ZZZZ
MLEVKIKIIGKTTEDLMTAIDQVKAKIEQGYANDHKANNDGNGAWHFNLFDVGDHYGKPKTKPA